MKLSNSGSVIAILGIAMVAYATGSLGKDFNANYKVAKTSVLGQATCSVCHVGKTKKLNPYGVDLAAAMAKEKSKTVTPAILKKIEGLDSDKDGKSNIDEIKADKLPGDPNSK